jgi:hypothetical protein
LNDGIAVAKVTKVTVEDCMANPADGKKVIIENVKVSVDGKDVGKGGQQFSWPSCFDISADVTIPADVDPASLAFEFVGHVMPMGSLKCADSLTCGRECYYCNTCQKNKAINDLIQGNTNDVCKIHSGGKQSVSMTVCPPQDLEKGVFCGGFNRQLVGNDYYKYDSAVNTQVRVWQRMNVEQRTKEFVALTSTSVGKNLIILQFNADNKFKQVSTPSDAQLLSWYTRNKEVMLACKRGIVDFSIAGDNINSNLMIDAFANVGKKAPVTMFSDKPCQEYLDAEAAEYKAMKAAVNVA